MLNLSSTSDLLRVVTDQAITVDVQATWVDLNAGTASPGRTNTAITTATTTTVVASPAASTVRNVKHLSVRNKHASTSCTVVVLHSDGTTIVEMFKATLAAGENLIFNEGEGFKVYSTLGEMKTISRPYGAVGGNMTMVNVRDYGATGDGTTNDLTAINNAIAAAAGMGVSARGVDVYFPAGVYAVNGAVVLNANNVMLVGSGWQSTVIYASHTTGDIVQIGNGTTKSGCGMTGISVWCSAARTTGASINVNAMNDCLIRDFVINNCFTGILVQGTSIKVWIDHGEVNNAHVADGIGISVVNGAAGDTYIGDIVMSNAPASKPAAGIQLSQTGHCSIFRCNVTSCVKGLLVNPVTSQDVTYLFIDHSLFDSCGSHGAHFSGTAAASSRIRSVMCVNSWFSGTTAAGSGIEFSIAAGAIVDGLSFVGCRILSNYNHGVTIGAGPTNISFTDCTIAGNGAQTSNTYDGFSIAANASGISVMNCKIGASGPQGNQQRYAANIAAGTSANVSFLGNDCQPNGTVGTHGYINSGALTGGGNGIDGNSPQAMSGMGAVTVAASGSITTTETVISAPFRLSANALRPGSVIMFRAAGSCTVSTAAAVGGKFVVGLGTAGTNADTEIMTFTPPTSGAVGTSVFNIEIVLVCRTAGASATFAGTLQGTQASATLGYFPSTAWALAGAAAAGNTTNANYLTLTFGLTGSANVACTFQIVKTLVEIG